MEPDAESREASRRAARAWTAVALVVVVLAAFVLTVAVATRHGASASARTVTVSATGTATGRPDTVNFEVGVQTTRPSASAALSANNTEMASLTTALERHGVTAKDVQTSGLNIYTNTDRRGAVTGFTVSNTLSVTMHDIANAGGAIDAAAGAVGNDVQFNGVTFSIADPTALMARARATAMTKADGVARQLAKAAGSSLGQVLKVVDHEDQTPPIVLPGSFATATKTSLQPGTQSVQVSVDVTYALR